MTGPCTSPARPRAAPPAAAARTRGGLTAAAPLLRAVSVISVIAVLAVIAVTAGPPPVRAQVALPDIGDSSEGAFGSAEEQEIGEEFMRELRAHVEVIDDPQVVDYVRAVGYELASHSGYDAGRFTFFVVGDPAINAFAAPGGFIGINSGLITATESESELASVVAHEIAHVTQRHIGRSIELQKKLTLPTLAGLAAAVLIGTQSPQAGRAAAAAVSAAGTSLVLKFSREHETEADRVGMQLLASAGFDPRAMPVFFERLQQEHRYYRAPPEFLSTHPVTTNRIADTRSRAEAFPYRQYPPSLTFELVRAKLRVREKSEPGEAVEYFRNAVEEGQYRSEEAARYGLALAYLQAGRHDEARETISPLAERDPDRIPYKTALARIEFADGRVDEALAIYEDMQSLYPGNRALTQGYAEALVRVGRPGEALRLINDYSRYHRMDASLWRLVAQAQERAGNRADSQAALAEHYYVLGQLDQALHQLRLANRAPNDDYYSASRIAARLNQLEAEKRRRLQSE